MAYPLLREIIPDALAVEEDGGYAPAAGTAVLSDEGMKEAAPLQDLVEALIGRILAQVREYEALPLDRDGREILLDTELRGVRCRFTRERRPNPRHGQITLSPRELEIARMVARGYPNKTIAAVLDISAWTVGTYLRRMFAKLGVCSRAAMIARMHEADIPVESNAQDSATSWFAARKHSS
jgi:DNA-binding CsgD family transcriptional regulator